MNALADLTPYAAEWRTGEKIYPNALEALTVNGSSRRCRTISACVACLP